MSGLSDAQISALHGKHNIPVKCLAQRPIFIQTKHFWCWTRNLSNYLDISFNLIKFNFASKWFTLNLSWFDWICYGALTFDTYEWSILYDPNRMFNVRDVPIQLWQSNKTIYRAPKTNEWNSHFHRWFGLTVFADQTPASLPKIWKIEKWKRVFSFFSSESNVDH